MKDILTAKEFIFTRITEAKEVGILYSGYIYKPLQHIEGNLRGHIKCIYRYISLWIDLNKSVQDIYIYLFLRSHAHWYWSNDTLTIRYKIENTSVCKNITQECFGHYLEGRTDTRIKTSSYSLWMSVRYFYKKEKNRPRPFTIADFRNFIFIEIFFLTINILGIENSTRAEYNFSHW